MNELAVLHSGLPTNIEDVAQFAIFAQEKLKSVKAEISAIKRLGLAQEVWEQKKREAQEIAELATDAFVKIGEFSVSVPKASGGDRRSEDFKARSASNFENGKMEALANMGFTKDQISQAKKMAENKDIVEQAKAEARDNDDIVSRSFVLEKIKSAERETKRAEIIENLESISAQKAKAIQGVYDVIVIDPPWDMKKIERDVTPNQSEFDYPTMTEQEIAQTKIRMVTAMTIDYNAILEITEEEILLCEHCGGLIVNDEYEGANRRGERIFICAGCAEHLYTECEHCGEMFHIDEITEADNGFLCGNCYENYRYRNYRN